MQARVCNPLADHVAREGLMPDEDQNIKGQILGGGLRGLRSGWSGVPRQPSEPDFAASQRKRSAQFDGGSSRGGSRKSMSWKGSLPNFAAILLRNSSMVEQADAMPTSIQMCSISFFSP
jgi:hypothetical protein